MSTLLHTVSAYQPITAIHIRTADEHDINAILTVHAEAFNDKFIGAFGPKNIENGIEVMAESWKCQGKSALSGMLVAEWQEQIIATTTLRTAETGPELTTAAELVFYRKLGLWGATRSLFALSLLSHPVGRSEGFVTDVAVLKEFRRHGVGMALLKATERTARELNKTFLSLYVSNANEGAFKLYETHGFRKVMVRRSWWTRLIYGQREWVFMRKSLLS